MYQIIKKRGEHGRPVVLKTYPTEESARQYLSSMNDEIFQKCIHAQTPERQYHTGSFWGTLLTYYTPSLQSVWLYIEKTHNN